jgi:hypothetical protein
MTATTNYTGKATSVKPPNHLAAIPDHLPDMTGFAIIAWVMLAQNSIASGPT